MGGKYKAMEFVRGAKGKATYLGLKRTKLHEEKQPSDWAKSVRRHQETSSKHKALKNKQKLVGNTGLTQKQHDEARRAQADYY